MQTSPVLACRRALPKQNVRGSVGFPIPGTSLRLVDPETLKDVPPGQQGLVRYPVDCRIGLQQGFLG